MKYFSQSNAGFYGRLFCYLIGLLVFSCFYGVLKNGLVWDDADALLHNEFYRGFSPSNILWMFSTFYNGNYHPLTWISFAMDFKLWGMNPAGFHLTNLLLHVANSILLFLLIIKFIKMIYKEPSRNNPFGIAIGALFGALFFALHPLRVETVAWLSTRGDLLCSFFYILTIFFYIKNCNKAPHIALTKWYMLSVFCFICSLLSRAWGMTLPAIMLIMDYSILERYQRGANRYFPLLGLIAEKLPYLFLAAGAGVLAILAKMELAVMPDLSQHGVLERMAQACYGISFYFWKTVVPCCLSPLYQFHEDFNPFDVKSLISYCFIAVIATSLVTAGRKAKAPLIALSCFVITVSPVLGIVQAGPQITADRYTYVATLPIGIFIGIGLFHFRNISYISKHVFHRNLFFCFFIGYLFLLSAVSHTQINVWKNDYTLWSRVISLDPKNDIAYWNRALLLAKHKQYQQASDDFTQVVLLNPNHYQAYNNRGVMKISLKMYASAITDFNMAIKINPSFSLAYSNKGIAYAHQSKWEKAHENCRKAGEFSETPPPCINGIDSLLNELGRE